MRRSYEDKLYEQKRNRLIPLAEKHANKVAGSRPINREHRMAWGSEWNRAFLGRMDELVAHMELGGRRPEQTGSDMSGPTCETSVGNDEPSPPITSEEQNNESS